MTDASELQSLSVQKNLVDTQPSEDDSDNSLTFTEAAQPTPSIHNTIPKPTFWQLPSIDLLDNPDEVKQQLIGDDTSKLASMIQETLRSFRVDAEVREEDISIGPTIIRFGIRPTGKPEMRLDEKTGKMMPVRDATGNLIYETRTRVNRIMALKNDLALVLEAKTIRMEAPVPERPYVGVEIPNKNSRLVTLREVLESKEYQAQKAKSKLAIGLGRDVAGLVCVGDLARMPHLLIAGTTGSGKSVCVNTIIASILTQATPDDVRLLMIDPKMVELSGYNGIPHLLSPVVTEVEKVVPQLKNAINEMGRRYHLLSQLGVRNLDGYHKLRLEKIAHGDTSLNNLPAIMIIINELADLMMAAPKEVEGMICHLAQLAHAIGIHLVVATQRPSVDVITNPIKANIPTRISFMVSSQVDSHTIIDMGGAERLLGHGDMLYLPADASRPERIQGAFLADEEAQVLVEYWKDQVIAHTAAISGPDTHREDAQVIVELSGEIKDESDNFELDDALFEKAKEIVRENGKASISLLQRRLRIGYSHAARLIDLLEDHGLIGHGEPSGRGRKVLNQNDDPGNHTISDEVADSMAEEKARDEFLRKQASSNHPIPPRRSRFGYLPLALRVEANAGENRRSMRPFMPRVEASAGVTRRSTGPYDHEEKKTTHIVSESALGRYKIYAKSLIERNSKKSRRLRWMHNILQMLILVGAALITFTGDFAAIPRWASPLIGLVVTIATVLSNSYKPGEKGRDLYRIVEEMQSEYNMFKSYRGSYKNLSEEEAFEKLQDRMDALRRERLVDILAVEEQKGLSQ